MMRNHVNCMIVFLLATSLVQSVSAKPENESQYTNLEQILYEHRIDIVKSLVANIELADAYLIEARNSTRKRDWKSITNEIVQNVIEAESYLDVSESVSSLSSALPSKHAFVSVSKQLRRSRPDFSMTARRKISFTYPNVEYYFMDSQESIVEIDNKLTALATQDFFDTKCKATTKLSCHFDFLMKLNFGLNPQTMTPIGSLKTESGTYQPVLDPGTNYSGCEGFKLKEVSPKITLIDDQFYFCIYDYNQNLLVKVPTFHFSQDEVFINDGCSKTNTHPACNARERILSEIRQRKPKAVIFDVRGNVGGNEVSPFAGIFLGKSIARTGIRYKLTELLYDPGVYNHISFGDEDANLNWLEKYVLSTNRKGQRFTMTRTDFCYSGENCLFTLKKNLYGQTTSVEDVFVISDARCMSACEDFIYQLLNSPSQATITHIGMPTMGDIAFARMRGEVGLRNGQVASYFSGQVESKELDTVLAIFSIPYSRTYNHAEDFIDGLPLVPENWPMKLEKSDEPLGNYLLRLSLKEIDLRLANDK